MMPATRASTFSANFVGQAILPAAAFQAAFSDHARVLARGERRLKARRLKAGGSQDWLPHHLILLILFAIALLSAQTNPVSDGIAAFNRGDYNAARLSLERSPADPQARLFLALTRAATGGVRNRLFPILRKRFSTGENRRLAGLALAQCQIAAKRFSEAGAIVAALEKQFPADADVLYVSAEYHMKAWNDAIYRMYEKAPSSYRVDQLSGRKFSRPSEGAHRLKPSPNTAKPSRKIRKRLISTIAWAARCCSNRTIPRLSTRPARNSKRNYR